MRRRLRAAWVLVLAALETIGPAAQHAWLIFDTRRKLRAQELLLLVLVLTGCPDLTGPTDRRVLDPCYSPTIVVDSLTLAVDTVIWEWTPGECPL